MNVVDDFKIISSFKEHIEHVILSKLGAWENKSVSLFPDSGSSRLMGYTKVFAPPKQWVYDSSISGATIASPSGLANPSWSSAYTDFKNAGFIMSGTPTGIPPSSGTAAVKRFNIYVSTKDDVELFENTLFDYPPELQTSRLVSIDNYHAPCLFIKLSSTTNQGLAFGGLDKTIYKLKVTCFCKSEFEILSLSSIMRDMKNTDVMVLSNTPLNEFNDLKSRPWSYYSEAEEAIIAGNPRLTIENSTFNILKSDSLANKLNNIYIGIATFDTFVARYPRQ